MFFDEWKKPSSPPPVSPELWERLIRGHCSRVLLLSPLVNDSMIALYFPQTLGLRPYRCRSSTSVPKKLAAEAAAVAATDRWIVEGELWAQYFLRRAEAIISVETPRVIALASPGRRTYLATEAVAGWLRRARAERRRHGTADQSPISTLDLALAPTAHTPSRSLKPLSLKVAEERYADKLIRISSRAQVRALRKVRAPR